MWGGKWDSQLQVHTQDNFREQFIRNLRIWKSALLKRSLPLYPLENLHNLQGYFNLKTPMCEKDASLEVRRPGFAWVLFRHISYGNLHKGETINILLWASTMCQVLTRCFTCYSVTQQLCEAGVMISSPIFGWENWGSGSEEPSLMS